ncbi:2-succinyl-5-enolpyruvyl-6-hydroxy-3-cyclohexene-1-carboxylic-acid synthase [Tepidiforma thermophila]|uniref:2-succinyl-5-enolpyruvyl-6-hydroxy-3-cyclohexene-1-carboxylate synthase n=1 Tax=Tepidiforma thermophila (strain KCTC 52669 / CGMCC 1.13589 / G233) TaxID=2761530 RepID=A0A2A9HH83_TEPT2|nr:2-succinyl-5-enolpyruvyl-6-hydroxy-3-cyclohexene-1-carboxylic-acid synthase [Tepidiforma thermophila]PFG74723.1 2-succinyl-5-enolpyruvyl-6-hydroxy-3-cyclohexene-1-carboxylate synthase [Tepidiforma thermophila]
MSVARENTAAARALIGGLAASGVRHAVVTPGSRSTPLVFALADQCVITPYLVIDERSAGFFALGLARKSGRPVAIACTSGTAVANLFPAVAEANLSRVPIIALTADRPPRLREVGAAQTIDQVHLFGRHVRWSVDLPVPGPGAAAAFQAAGTRAVQASVAGLPGPVQVNVPFDEPLVEPPADHPAPYEPTPGDLPAPQLGVPERLVEYVAERVRAARRPLIIAGPETGGLPAEPLLRLAETLGAPILADPLSGLRAGVPDGAPVLDAFDAWLRSVPSPTPDFVLRFGAAPTSKALNQLLGGWSDAVHVLVDLPGGYREPNGTGSIVLTASPAAAAEALAAVPAQAEAGWRERWLEADRAARAALDAASREPCELFEGRVFTELRDLLPPGATLVAGNSMPVRDLDNFFGLRREPLDIAANRGANGIDGVISSAAGAAAAAVPTAVVVGDVSFLHDLNALWAAREHRLPLLIIVVNNDGGGIFHYLPQAAHTDAFERWFATPPGIEPGRAAALFDLPFCRAESWPAFREAVEGWVRNPGPFVVEVRTDRRANVAMHQRAWTAAARAAAEVVNR